MREVRWLTAFEVEDLVGYWTTNPPTHVALALLAPRAAAPERSKAFVDPEFGDMKRLLTAMGGGRNASR